MALLWAAFDCIGTLAFALSGSLVGISRRMDIFGIFVLAAVTAIGGGIMRDMMIGRFPPLALQSIFYIALISVVVIPSFIVYRYIGVSRKRERSYQRVYLVADALGLASFTVTGASAGMFAYPEYPVCAVILGLITAVGGGLIRDVLAQRIPSVLKEDVYAIPSFLGGTVYVILAMLGDWEDAAYITFFFVFIFRVLVVKYHLNLPKI